jgi:hypothetical protein
MLDSFERRGDFLAEVKYAERLDGWLTDWLPNNLSVIDEFLKITKKLYDDIGREHYGAQAVYEVMRFHRLERESASEFKLNNNNVALIARYIMAKYPEYEGFFSLRTINGIPETRAKHIFQAAMYRAGQLPAAQAELF